MPTEYTAYAFSQSIAEESETPNYLLEEILRAIQTNTSIPAACLRAASKSPVEIDPVGLFDYTENEYVYGLPKTGVSELEITFNRDDLNRSYLIPQTDIGLYGLAACRINNRNLIDNGTEEYTDTKELYDLMYLSLDDMVNSIKENPDIRDIEDAFVGFTVPILTEDSLHHKWMFDFFEKLIPHFEGTLLNDRVNRFNDNIRKTVPVFGGNQPPPDNAEEIIERHLAQIIEPNEMNMKDCYAKGLSGWHWNVIHGEFKFGIAYDYSYTEIEAGNIGSIGTVTKETFIVEPVKVVTDVTGGANSSEGKEVYYWLDPSYIKYTKQISDTEVKCLYMYGLRKHTFISKQDMIESLTLHAVLTDPDVASGFFIPMEHYSMLATLEEEEYLSIFGKARTLHINALNKQKLKWYETDLFQGLLKFVFTFISLISLQPWIASAVVGGFALVTAITTLVLSNLVISALAQFIVETFGIELAFLIAIAATILSLGTDAASFLELIKPDELLKNVSSVSGKLGSSITDAIGQESQDILREIYEEREGVLSEYNDRQDEFADAIAELDTANTSSDPYNYIGDPYFDPNETPDLFFERTIHYKNPGVLIYSAIENYVEASLTLPEANKEFGIS